MKQKLIILLGLGLLLVIIVWIVKDLFHDPSKEMNPYEYDLSNLKAGDTTQAVYIETGSFQPSLKNIKGVAVHPSGKVFVCGENGVEIFDTAGKTIGRFNVNGLARFITLNEGFVYLGLEDHIEIFNETGKLSQKWVPQSNESILTSAAIYGDDVFVADAGVKTVYHYNKQGKLINRIGDEDPKRGIPGFVVPSPFFDLAVGKDGNVWVANTGRHSIEKYDKNGDLLYSWGKSGVATDRFCGCCNPSHFAMFANDVFVTSEKGIERVKISDSTGKLLGVVAFPASFTEGTKGLDLAIDRKNRILILDPERNLIRIFTPKINPKGKT